VVTIVLPEQRRDAAALLRKAGLTVRPQQVNAQSHPVTALVGEPAPYRAPVAKPAAPAPKSSSDGARRRRPSRGGQPGGATHRGQTPSATGRNEQRKRRRRNTARSGTPRATR
jgi:hypothetical protein